jgi:hypothetical protein
MLLRRCGSVGLRLWPLVSFQARHRVSNLHRLQPDYRMIRRRSFASTSFPFRKPSAPAAASLHFSIMATVIALLLFVFTTILFRPVTGVGIDYRGTVAQTWPRATAYSPMVPQPGPKVTPTARIHRAQLQKRQLANIFVASMNWVVNVDISSFSTLTVHTLISICRVYRQLQLHFSCVADRTLSPVAAFCSEVGSDDVPITAVFDYGSWPLGGCFNADGQLCW